MRPLAVALTALAVTAGPAAAGPWSEPDELLARLPHACFVNGSVPSSCVQEMAPRVAVNAHGEALVVWTTQTHGFEVHAAFARHDGRFAAPVRLGFGLRPQPLLRDDGSAVVVWTGAKTLQFARSAGGGRFARPRKLTPQVHYARAEDGDDDPRLLAEPDGAAAVLYQNMQRVRPGAIAMRIRAVDLPRSGPPAPPVEVTRGNLTDATVAPGGGIAVCCARGRGLATRAPGATAWSIGPAPGSGSIVAIAAADARIAAAYEDPDGHAAGVFDVAWDGSPGDRFATMLGGASYPIGSQTIIDGQDRTDLVYVERQGPAFVGPLYAVSAAHGEQFGPRIRLDRRFVWEPLVAPLPVGVLVAWAANDHWGLATLRHGVLHRVRLPSGPGPGRFTEDANPNRSLATAGPYAALAWETARGAIRASIARYD